jgi:hypothetical protein
MAVDLNGLERDEARMLQRLANTVVDTLTAQLSANEQQRDLLLAHCADVTALAAQLGATVRRQWRSCCDEVAAGRTEVAHALRAALAGSTADTLALLERFRSLVVRTTASSGREVAGAKDLAGVIAWLERFRDVVLATWTSPEALEELAGEHYPLSSEELDAIGARHPAPAAWYEQEGKPF